MLTSVNDFQMNREPLALGSKRGRRQKSYLAQRPNSASIYLTFIT